MKIKKHIDLITNLFFGGLVILPDIFLAQEIALPSILTDQMVLQGDRKVSVWGTAALPDMWCGQKVEVG